MKKKKDLPFNQAKVYCSKHGNSEPGIICRHLEDCTGLRFFEIYKEPWAWCEACDAVLEKERDFTERLSKIADFRVYCRKCYIKTLRRHQRIEFVRFKNEAD